MENVISRETARSIFDRVWNGIREKDSFFLQALAIFGISEADFDRLQREARKQERGIPRLVVLTPTGLGRRR